VNPIKADRTAVLARLQADGIDADVSALSPYGIRVKGRPNIAIHPLFKDGAIEIQDEASQLVGLIADTRPGHQVVDFCAGAGGKTLAMAASMENRGRIVACDVLEGRLRRAKERFRRAGVHNVETRPLSSENDKWVKRHKDGFDRVVVDAPCTGTGTWRRNPDMRWRRLGPELDELAALQARLLDSAARLVKPGGRLVYATCSLLPEENDNQAEAFLARRPEFRPAPLAEIWDEVVAARGGGALPSADPYLKLTPARNQTDGFFAAVFDRAAG
jgi:16S rRNA (cytosine967-C5)-methyltransferase